MGMGLSWAMAQDGSRDADDWDNLRGRRNIFALRQVLAADAPVSDGVRALGMAYIGAFSRDFERAQQNLDHARHYAITRGDTAFLRDVEEIAQVLLRERGQYHTLAAQLSQSQTGGTIWQRMVSFWAEMPTSFFMGVPAFSLPNISPDDARIIVPVQFGGVAGTMLLDTGAESSLLSAHYADRYGALPSGVRFSMLTVDGPRVTQLARLSSLELGPARFGAVNLGVQTQSDGVIGFFLNEGATGILGFPLLARFGEIDFQVEHNRVARVTLRRPLAMGSSNDTPNMMIREDKPYIHVTVEGETYSCIFDTGAPRSLFSGTIIARHQKNLRLEDLSLREAKKAGLFWEGTASMRHIRRLPIRAGHREISLENVQVLEGGGPASDFCLVGLDAVIASGGARMNMQALQLHFGENNSLAAHAFNLR